MASEDDDGDIGLRITRNDGEGVGCKFHMTPIGCGCALVLLGVVVAALWWVLR